MEYVFFGTALRYLQDCAAGWRIHRDEQGGYFILDNLRIFLKGLDDFELPVTKKSADSLREVMQELGGTPDDAKLTADQAKEVRKELELVRHTLEAEAKLTFAFVTTEKRIEVKKLLGDVGSVMPPGVFKRLPNDAREDLVAAGRALAFELSTAAAFHALRATEAVLRHFYRCVIKQRRLKNPMWAGMVQQMRSKKTNAPDDTLLDVLDRIRVNFRNPTAHPDKFFDIHEAQELFLACVEATGRMVRSSQWVDPT